MIRTELIAPVSVLLARHARERGEKTAFEDARASITYRQLDSDSAALAARLQELVPEVGSAVAILVPNSVDWVIACLAVVRAGCVAVPISHDATEPEIRYRLEDAQCRLVFTSQHHLPLVSRLRLELPQLEHVVVTGTPSDASVDVFALRHLVTQKAAAVARDAPDIDSVSFIVYTSGTTGKAKGVMLTQRSMLWVVAACWAPIAGLSESDVVLSPLPLFHSYALNFCVLGVLAVGATEYLMERFSIQDVLSKLASGRFTVMPGVPTMFHYILESTRQVPDQGLAGVRLFISAGAIMPSALNSEFESRFGIELLDGYGITETSTMVTLNWPGKDRMMGSCGLPVPGLAVRIVAGDGKDASLGEEGELIVRGPNLMQGYLKKPIETALALQDGWYHTGDLARSDLNGYLTITGRLKELIIRGGQNIAPGEVEEAVLSHPDILDCAVVGIAHKHLGEVPVAFVLRRGNSVFDTEVLLAHCHSLLSSYKVPQAFHVVDAIPRTGSGKIMRFKLREWLEQQAVAQHG